MAFVKRESLESLSECLLTRRAVQFDDEIASSPQPIERTLPKDLFLGTFNVELHQVYGRHIHSLEKIIERHPLDIGRFTVLTGGNRDC